MTVTIEKMVKYGRLLLAKHSKSPEDAKVKSSLFSSLQREFPGEPPEDYRKALLEIAPSTMRRPPNKIAMKCLAGPLPESRPNIEPVYGFVSGRLFRKTPKSLHEVNCIMTPESERELLDEWNELSRDKVQLTILVKEMELELKSGSLEFETAFDRYLQTDRAMMKREMRNELEILDTKLFEKRRELATCQFRIEEIEEQHRTGTVIRRVECVELFDFEAETVGVQRLDTCDIIKRRAMTEEEKAELPLLRAGSGKRNPPSKAVELEEPEGEDKLEEEEPVEPAIAKGEAPSFAISKPSLPVPQLKAHMVGVPKLNLPEVSAEPEEEEPEDEGEEAFEEDEKEDDGEPDEPGEVAEESEDEEEVPENTDSTFGESENSESQNGFSPSPEGSATLARKDTQGREFLRRQGQPTTPGDLGFSAAAIARLAGCHKASVFRYFKCEPVLKEAAVAIETAIAKHPEKVKKENPVAPAKKGNPARRAGEPTTAKAIGLSALKIAALIGCSESTVTRYFRGEEVALETLLAIEKVVSDPPEGVKAIVRGDQVSHAPEAPSGPSEPSALEKIAALEKQLEELKASLK